MDNKTEIVEKRVKGTVIRRRRQVVESQPEELVEEQQASDQAGVEQALIPPGSAQAVAESKGLVVAKGPVKVTEVEKAAAAAKAKPKAIEELVPETESEEDKKKKSIKVKKGVKKRETLDVDGIGRVSSITQLNRVATADRVFEPSRLGRRKKIIPRKGMRKTVRTESKAIKRIIEMTDAIGVSDLAQGMGVKVGEVIKKFMDMGTMVTANQKVDQDTAALLAQEFKFEIKDVRFDETKLLNENNQGREERLEPRPPIVTVMGHVDHGKTSLLDAIRSTNVVGGEHGGITQHIGAYTVQLKKGKLTFLDTPGHEAFTTMRARGAKVTDIVILVVAADDGVMPQTIESIDHAKVAGVPIVVAVNKIDKPEADTDRVKRELAEHGLSPEEWGGDTLFTYVSAIKKEGIDELLETVLLQTEVLELKANTNCLAMGVVLEARLDKGRGPVATLLVKKGVLRRGDILIAGVTAGRVRAMTDHLGQSKDEARPSEAVEVLGLADCPSASDSFHVVSNDQLAQKIISHRLSSQRQIESVVAPKLSLEEFFAKSQAQEHKELAVIIKADVQGSLEAVREALTKLNTEKVGVKIIHGAVGGVNESDVLLASASKAVVIGFNVRPETKSIATAEREGVDVKLYKIIYDMVREVKLAMQGLLAPTRKEHYLGRAEVRQTFTVSKVGLIAGCSVTDGKVTRTAELRLLRDNVVLFEGKVASLKRFKDDAKEVLKGFECGIGLEGYQDIKPGDVLEAYEIELIQPEL